VSLLETLGSLTVVAVLISGSLRLLRTTRNEANLQQLFTVIFSAHLTQTQPAAIDPQPSLPEGVQRENWSVWLVELNKFELRRFNARLKAAGITWLFADREGNSVTPETLVGNGREKLYLWIQN